MNGNTFDVIYAGKVVLSNVSQEKAREKMLELGPKAKAQRHLSVNELETTHRSEKKSVYAILDKGRCTGTIVCGTWETACRHGAKGRTNCYSKKFNSTGQARTWLEKCFREEGWGTTLINTIIE